MNLFVINGAPIGSGVPNHRVFADALQAFVLTAQYSGNLIKRAALAGVLSLQGSARSVNRVAFTLSAQLGVVGSLPFRAWVKTYSVASNVVMRLLGVGQGGVRVVGAATNTTLALLGATTVQIHRITRATGATVLSLLGAALARPHWARYMQMGGWFSLGGVAVPRQLTAQHGAMTQALVLTGFAEGEDVYDGPAPLERTFFMSPGSETFTMYLEG